MRRIARIAGLLLLSSLLASCSAKKSITGSFTAPVPPGVASWPSPWVRAAGLSDKFVQALAAREIQVVVAGSASFYAGPNSSAWTLGFWE